MITAEELRKMYEIDRLSTRDICAQIGWPYQRVRSALIFAGTTFDKKARISAKAKGRTSPMKGKVRSLESRLKQSASTKGVKRAKGQRRTTEQKKKMSESKLRFIAENKERFNAIRLKATNALRARSLSPEERKRKATIRNRCKNLVRRLVKRYVFHKNQRTQEILGYSIDEFRRHIERQFINGMSWNKPWTFHIDHIVPLDDFIRRGIADPAIINALPNLRPFPPLENRRKQAQRMYLL